jgi:hypothetical protein
VFYIFQRYVASVSEGCCKSRSDVAYVAMVVHIYLGLLMGWVQMGLMGWVFKWVHSGWVGMG